MWTRISSLQYDIVRNLLQIRYVLDSAYPHYAQSQLLLLGSLLPNGVAEILLILIHSLVH